MPQDPRADETRQIQHVREDLTREFTGVAPDVVEEQVAQVADAFQTALRRSKISRSPTRAARATGRPRPSC